MKFKLLIFATFLIIPVGCKPRNYQDISDSISSQALPVPEGEYTSVAWLDDDHIAFIYKPEEFAANGLNIDFRIGIFEMSSGKLKMCHLHFFHLIACQDRVVFLNLRDSRIALSGSYFAAILAGYQALCIYRIKTQTPLSNGKTCQIFHQGI